MTTYWIYGEPIPDLMLTILHLFAKLCSPILLCSVFVIAGVVSAAAGGRDVVGERRHLVGQRFSECAAVDADHFRAGTGSLIIACQIHCYLVIGETHSVIRKKERI